MRENKEINIWETRDVKIKRKGSEITLPANPQNMPIPEAIKALHRLEEAENEKVQCIEHVDAFVLDGAVAFIKALERTFGWANAKAKKTFFGPQPPKMVGVDIGNGKTIQVPFGEFEIPTVEGRLETHASSDGFVITAEVAKRDAHIIKDIANLTRRIVKMESIYKGKAVHLKTGSDHKLSLQTPPSFIDPSSETMEDLVLNANVKEAVESSILTPIKHTKTCREARIPLNRGILLEGIYGVGKSMIATAIAKVCEDNGWSFLMLDRAESLEEGLLFAKRYAPAVVFCEDIDRITSERDEKANDLLNTIDGVLTKNSEVISIMTTNHVARINKAMLRPGRLDAVISITAPDKDSVQDLIKIYSRGLIDQNENLEEVGEKLAGQIPATIREVVERSKLRAIPRAKDGKILINQEDLLHASDEMSAHLELLNRKEETEPRGAEKVALGYNELFADAEFMKKMEKVGVISNRKITDIHGIVT